MAFRSSSRINCNGISALRQAYQANPLYADSRPWGAEDELGNQGAGGSADDHGGSAGAQVIDQETGESANSGADHREHQTFGHVLLL